eukprot:5474637-Pyramimonas_sp.AAC.1
MEEIGTVVEKDSGWPCKFEDLSEYALQGPEWLNLVLAHMDLMIGERESDEVRRLGRRAAYEASRESQETLIQFASRREAQLLEAEGHELWMSGRFIGLLLKEGASLAQQGLQNLRALTRGSLDFGQVSWALGQMDSTGSERFLPSRPRARVALVAGQDGLPEEARPSTGGRQTPLITKMSRTATMTLLLFLLQPRRHCWPRWKN